MPTVRAIQLPDGRLVRGKDHYTAARNALNKHDVGESDVLRGKFGVINLQNGKFVTFQGTERMDANIKRQAVKDANAVFENVRKWNTYVRRSLSEGEWNTYQKTAPIIAKQMKKPFRVTTKEGPVSGKAGDYLCIGVEAEMWPVDKTIFEKTMKKVADGPHRNLKEGGPGSGPRKGSASKMQPTPQAGVTQADTDKFQRSKGGYTRRTSGTSWKDDQFHPGAHAAKSRAGKVRWFANPESAKKWAASYSGDYEGPSYVKEGQKIWKVPSDLSTMDTKELRLLQLRVFGNAMKAFPSSPRQQEIHKELERINAEIKRRGMKEIIQKHGSGYRLVSHKGKNLGDFSTKAAAEKHEREVEYFKSKGK